MYPTELAEAATFVQVVESGGFSAAARVMGLPKSTVSRRVARLEERLGVQLLHRTTRSMRLTDAGELFRASASHGLQSLRDAFSAVREASDTPSGVLRLTAPPDLAEPIAELVAGFSRKYPDVFVVMDLTSERVDLVTRGYDAALRAGTLADSSLVAKKLAPADAGIYASPAYLADHGTPEHPKDLAGHHCVLFRELAPKATWRLKRGREEVSVAVNGVTSADDLGYVKNATVNHMGFAWLPFFLVTREVREGRLTRVLPEWRLGGGALYLVYPPSRHIPARLRTFRDFAHENMQKLLEVEFN